MKLHYCAIKWNTVLIQLYACQCLEAESLWPLSCPLFLKVWSHFSRRLFVHIVERLNWPLLSWYKKVHSSRGGEYRVLCGILNEVHEHVWLSSPTIGASTPQWRQMFSGSTFPDERSGKESVGGMVELEDVNQHLDLLRLCSSELISYISSHHITISILYCLYSGVGSDWRVSESRSRHWRFCKAMEEVCRTWNSREREISTGVEEQECTSETVHDESTAPRSHDLCCQVGARLLHYNLQQESRAIAKMTAQCALARDYRSFSGHPYYNGCPEKLR